MGAKERAGIGFKKSRNAAGHGCPCRQGIRDAGPRRKQIPERIALHTLPEFPETLEALVNRIAGDDAGVDRPDRGADDPIGLDLRFMQGLVDATLIGPERTASLQNEHDLPICLLADHIDGVKWRSIP
jgi:hypothetical protein